MTVGNRRPGDFCWINILTPQPDDARAFFAKVLDWTYTEMPGMGHRVFVNGKNIGGIFDLDAPTTPPGTPPVIGVMVKVRSADAAAEQVTSLGGKAMHAFDVADAGRMAVCFDPNGANIDVWEPKTSHGIDADSTHHGAPSWFESATTDVERASAFYSALFGWTTEELEMPGLTYTTFRLDDAPVAGMLPITPEMGNAQPNWSTYFTVSDVDATARQTVELGGSVSVPAQDIPNVGRFCGLVSPQGVMFYAIAYSA